MERDRQKSQVVLAWTILCFGVLIMSAHGQGRAGAPNETPQKTPEQRELEAFNPWLVKLPAKQPRPTLPYESHGACPFECCTYRQWTVERDTEIFDDYRAKTPVKFHVTRGQKVVAVTGVVVTTKFGVGVVRSVAGLGGFNMGDTLHVLHHLGEDHWKYWFDGYFSQAPITPRQRCPSCEIELVEAPQTIWWVKIRAADGREGWTRQPEHFGNKDACG